MYETYNYLVNYIKKIKNLKNLKDNYRKILICFSPVIPHFSSECLLEIDNTVNVSWPEFNKKFLEEDKINIVIQINGKKRTILNAERGSGESELLEIIKKDKIVEKYLNNYEIKKIIFVQDRLMNILINE